MERVAFNNAEKKCFRSKATALKAFLKEQNAKKNGDDYEIYYETLPLLYQDLIVFIQTEDAKHSTNPDYKPIFAECKFEEIVKKFKECKEEEKEEAKMIMQQQIQKMELFIAKRFFHDNIVEVEQQLVAIKSKHYCATWAFRRIPSLECAFCMKVGDNIVYDEVLVGIARSAYDMTITMRGAPISTPQFKEDHCVVMVHIFNTIMKTTVVETDASFKVLTLPQWITSIEYIGKKFNGFSERIAQARPDVKLATTPIPLQQTEPL